MALWIIFVLGRLWLDLVSFLCKLLKKCELLGWEAVSFLRTGTVWFTISVPAFGVKIRQFSGYFHVVCFHAVSRYFLPIDQGLCLVVYLSWYWLLPSLKAEIPWMERWCLLTIPLHLCTPDVHMNACKRTKYDFPTPMWIKSSLQTWKVCRLASRQARVS